MTTKPMNTSVSEPAEESTRCRDCTSPEEPRPVPPRCCKRIIQPGMKIPFHICYDMGTNTACDSLVSRSHTPVSKTGPIDSAIFCGASETFKWGQDIETEPASMESSYEFVTLDSFDETSKDEHENADIPLHGSSARTTPIHDDTNTIHTIPDKNNQNDTSPSNPQTTNSGSISHKTTITQELHENNIEKRIYETWIKVKQINITRRSSVNSNMSFDSQAEAVSETSATEELISGLVELRGDDGERLCDELVERLREVKGRIAGMRGGNEVHGDV